MLRDKRSSVRDLQERESFEIYDLILDTSRGRCVQLMRKLLLRRQDTKIRTNESLGDLIARWPGSSLIRD
jgi:hypothetical protein